MTIITKKSLVAAGILSALITANVAMAADVPAGVQLADKQSLVRNNGNRWYVIMAQKCNPSTRIRLKAFRNPTLTAICLKG